MFQYWNKWGAGSYNKSTHIAESHIWRKLYHFIFNYHEQYCLSHIANSVISYRLFINFKYSYDQNLINNPLI